MANENDITTGRHIAIWNGLIRTETEIQWIRETGEIIVQPKHSAPLISTPMQTDQYVVVGGRAYNIKIKDNTIKIMGRRTVK